MSAPGSGQKATSPRRGARLARIACVLAALLGAWWGYRFGVMVGGGGAFGVLVGIFTATCLGLLIVFLVDSLFDKLVALPKVTNRKPED